MCSVCPGGDDGRVGSGSTAIRIEDLLSSHPYQFLLFLQGENNLKMAVCKFCKSFFRGMCW